MADAILCPRCEANKVETGKLPAPCSVPGCDNHRTSGLEAMRTQLTRKKLKGVVGT